MRGGGLLRKRDFPFPFFGFFALREDWEEEEVGGDGRVCVSVRGALLEGRGNYERK